jgi:hypothetical protein
MVARLPTGFDAAGLLVVKKIYQLRDHGLFNAESLLAGM